MENFNTIPDTMPVDAISRVIPVFESFSIWLYKWKWNFPNGLIRTSLQR